MQKNSYNNSLEKGCKQSPTKSPTYSKWWLSFLVSWILYVILRAFDSFIYILNKLRNTSNKRGYEVFKDSESCWKRFKQGNWEIRNQNQICDIIIETILIVSPGIILFTFHTEFFCDLSPSYKKMVSAFNVLVASISLDRINVSQKLMNRIVAKTIVKHLFGHIFHLFGYAVAFFVIMPHHVFENDETQPSEQNATVFSNFYDSFLKVLF